jgi:hypothetical protein
MLSATSAAARFRAQVHLAQVCFVFGFACAERDLVSVRRRFKAGKQEYIEPHLTQRSSPESAVPKAETVTDRPEDKAGQRLPYPTICRLCNGLDIIGWNTQSTIYADIPLLGHFRTKVRRSMNSRSTLIASTIMSPEQIGPRGVCGGPYFASRFQNRIGTFSK